MVLECDARVADGGYVHGAYDGRRRDVHDVVAAGTGLEVLVAEVVEIGQVGLEVREARERRDAAVA